MITFILPGYSAHNKEWAEEVAAKLKLEGQIRPIFWDHWEDPKAGFKLKEKVRLLVSVASGEKVNIIAKSVGTLVGAHLVKEIPENVEKVILCGIPSVSEARLKTFSNSYATLSPEKIICFQNTKDPFVSYNQLKEFLKKVSSKIKVIEKPRTDHNYPYFEDFQKYLSS
ncbi:alpha/beta hydrolase [Patescibacteria group bacterium]